MEYNRVSIDGDNYVECKILQHICFLHGYDITLREAENLWSKYSSDFCAGWLINDWKDFDTTWKRIRYLFKEVVTEEEFEENLKEQENDIYCLMNYKGCDYEVVIEVNRIAKNPYRGFCVLGVKDGVLEDVTEETIEKWEKNNYE